MTHRLSPSFTTNLIFGVLLFLITITFRTKLVYALIDNIYLVATLLHAWNWLMSHSLGIAAVQSLTLAYRHGGLYYMLLSIGVTAFLLFTAIGMFLIPQGAILS